MAAGRQDQPQGHHDGGQSSGIGGTIREGRQFVQERAEQVGQRMREGLESTRDAMGQGYHQAEEMVTRNPTESLLITFGLGFGLGLLLTAALSSREESWYDRYVPDSMHDLRHSLRNLPDRISDAIARNMPGR